MSFRAAGVGGSLLFGVARGVETLVGARRVQHVLGNVAKVTLGLKESSLHMIFLLDNVLSPTGAVLVSWLVLLLFLWKLSWKLVWMGWRGAVSWVELLVL